ncbi:hypothetical protein GGH91_001446 [Coemansia sp. RSA 2671]|nr:hypothetical protein LPJ60_002255 [Coemansia sp. RSA 2675]KAJ2348290.1 hypothetical protein GGH91_001446 [Coemansia sp. RSA 2671]
MTASGLQGAPVTKLWLTGIGLASALAGLFGWRHNLRLQLAAAPNGLQFWRLLTSLSGFSTWPEVLAALVLAYELRVVERVFGSRRFASFLVVAGIVGQALTVAAMQLAGLRAVAGGPYALLLACVCQYWRLVPRSYYVRVAGVAVPDTWGVYAAAACLVAPRLLVAAVPAGAGVVAGMAYSADVAGLGRWRLPLWMASLARRWLAPVASARSASTEADVASEHVDAIAGMFPDARREHIVEVLRMVGNDANRAVAMLLDSS